jgi:hypothetical protein
MFKSLAQKYLNWCDNVSTDSSVIDIKNQIFSISLSDLVFDSIRGIHQAVISYVKEQYAIELDGVCFMLAHIADIEKGAMRHRADSDDYLKITKKGDKFFGILFMGDTITFTKE